MHLYVKIAFALLGFIAINVKPSEETIPFSMFKKLRGINSTKDFIDKLLDPQMIQGRPVQVKPIPGHDDVESRPNYHVSAQKPLGMMQEPGLGDKPGAPGHDMTNEGSLGGSDMIAGMIAEEDVCNPKITSVKIPPDNDPDVIFWPACTPLEQCGGCCGHEMLECSPSQARMEKFQVLRAKYPYPGADRFVFEGFQDVFLERHTACECRCRVQPQHCHPEKHDYLEESCRCRCKNEHLAASCPSHKKWSEKHCECQCAHNYHCMTDEEINPETCRCEPKKLDIPIVNPNDAVASDIVQPEPCPQCLPGYVAVRVSGKCDCVIKERTDQEGYQPLPKEEEGMPKPPVLAQEGSLGEGHEVVQPRPTLRPPLRQPVRPPVRQPMRQPMRQPTRPMRQPVREP